MPKALKGVTGGRDCYCATQTGIVSEATALRRWSMGARIICQLSFSCSCLGFDILEVQADLVTLDKLRPRLHRLRDLLSRGEDTDMALGSDIYSFSLDAYASLKIVGKAKSQATQPAGETRQAK